MRVTSNFVFLAALASFSSAPLVVAAPTDTVLSDVNVGGLNSYTYTQANDPVHDFNPAVATAQLQTRQLGGVVDTVAGLLPGIVDKVLDLLGLKRTSDTNNGKAGASNATASDTNSTSSPGFTPLTSEQASLVEKTMQSMLGSMPLPLSLPLPTNPLNPAVASVDGVLSTATNVIRRGHDAAWTHNNGHGSVVGIQNTHLRRAHVQGGAGAGAKAGANADQFNPPLPDSARTITNNVPDTNSVPNSVPNLPSPLN